MMNGRKIVELSSFCLILFVFSYCTLKKLIHFSALILTLSPHQKVSIIYVNIMKVENKNPNRIKQKENRFDKYKKDTIFSDRNRSI